MTKLWGGRFSAEGGTAAESFTASLPFDRRLYRQDIRGSIAHARMLGQQGIITPAEAAVLIEGLQQVEQEIEQGQFPFRTQFEDIHLNIEQRLIELVGPVGGKLHTARSRNDQVATDTHLFVKDEIAEILVLITRLQVVIIDKVSVHQEVIMPGYTHLQRAQPILFAHHLLVYFWMLERDYGRLQDCLRRADLSPLGAGALAGTTFPIDRAQTAAELGFQGVYENSLDAVSDRDYIVEFLAAAALVQMHLSRLAEELINWSSQEFGFIEMDDAYATGSSIMPQKKNPDVAELVRGKTGRVYGNLMALLTVLKGLPLAYHTDLQEDKERLFDTVDTLKACLAMTAGMVATLRVRSETMAAAVRQDFANATDLADYLAKKGMPFRDAHAVVGRIVAHCLDRGVYLSDLALADLRGFSDLIADDVFAAIAPETCVALRRSRGGTAPEEVTRQIALARTIVAGRGGTGS